MADRQALAVVQVAQAESAAAQAGIGPQRGLVLQQKVPIEEIERAVHGIALLAQASRVVAHGAEERHELPARIG